ncbi:pentapeptide repeat-containing protein [Pedobacter sp. L105]|uniref:pentapeptide repeat-containing protein n=1 Tax=Pedobacter sp. L105 TaxID=1641871 RepID=UPI00131BD537|nr:pentapeptide repeat-containing protein [Pedobacter sp. L105]
MSNADEPISHYNKRFESINYEEKHLVGRYFDNCVFYKSTLKGCLFDDCTFTKCTFEETDLSLIKFKDTYFSDCVLINCKAIGVLWYDTLNPFSIQAKGSILSYSSFFGKNLKKVKLQKCIAWEVDFTGANMGNGDLSGTDFMGSTFSDTDLRLANFTAAQNYHIDPAGNKIKGATFQLPAAISFLDSLGIKIVD